MCAVAAAPQITPEEFLALPDHERFELVDGQLVEANVSTLSSWVGGVVHVRLSVHVTSLNLGYVWPADQMYRCFPSDPDKIRKPDVSFIRRERIRLSGADTGYCAVAPDLVVEVLSPNDLAYDIDEKIKEYLEAGVLLVWVVHPVLRMVYVHRANGSVTAVREHEELSGEDVVPGFVCPVGGLFPPIELKYESLTPPAQP